MPSPVAVPYAVRRQSGLALSAAVLASAPAWMPTLWVYLTMTSVVASLVVLSVVVLARATSSISLAQGAFMGISAYLFTWLFQSHGWPYVPAALISIVAVVPIGMLLAFPALRLRGIELSALLPLIPVFLSYVLSFVYVAIYWNNHHHMMHAVQHVDGSVLWANMHLLFWLSLIPFVTGWMSENHFETVPVALGFIACETAVPTCSSVRPSFAAASRSTVTEM